MTTALDYMGKVKPSARSKAVEVLNKVSGANRITHIWGYDPNAGNPEHHSGLALDFMVFRDKALGDRIYNYLWANRVRLGVKHVIWYQTITSTVTEPGVRRAMSDRGNDTNNHKDHVHVLFFDKAYQAPGAEAPKPKPPKTVSILKVGSKGSAVRALQKGLNDNFPAYSRLSVDGDFGPKTKTVVKEFQRRSGLTRDGIVGSKTRVALAKYGITV
jgi:hypothetical protein